MSYRMLTGVPARKVQAATLAAAGVKVLAWIITLLSGEPIPPLVEDSLVVLAVYAAGYLTPPAARDNVISTEAPTLAP